MVVQTKRIKRPILVSAVTFLIAVTVTGTTTLLTTLLDKERAAYPPATALLLAVGVSAAIAVVATGLVLYFQLERRGWVMRAWQVACLLLAAFMFGGFLWLRFFASPGDPSLMARLEWGCWIGMVGCVSVLGLMTYMAIRGWVNFYRRPHGLV